MAHQPEATRPPPRLQVSGKGIARIAHNVKKKTERTIQSFVLLELFELMESLILAQDERWRRA